MSLWQDQLLPASWRGIPFGVKDSGARFGRRVAVHEYPFRDEIWIEDLGRAPPAFTLSGFTVGDDCYVIRDLLRNAAQQPGPGVLVHPSLGPLTVNLTSFSATERRELGRVVQYEFEFVQGSSQLFPLLGSATQNQVGNLVNQGVTSLSQEFGVNIVPYLNEGALPLENMVATATSFVTAGMTLAKAPEVLFGAVAGIATAIGQGMGLGRYSGGNLSAIPAPALAASQAAPNPQAAVQAAVSAQLSATVAAATLAQSAGTALIAAAPNGGTFATQAYTFTEAFRSVANDPFDQVQMLTGLYNSPVPAALQAPDAISSAVSGAVTTTASMLRRAALLSLANATSSYQPTSYDDAMALMEAAVALYDAEMVAAADAGDDAAYAALGAVLASIVSDLTTRGADLPRLITITTGSPQASLTLAYRLYRDATRADDLTARANPINPLFMPTSFQALSS